MKNSEAGVNVSRRVFLGGAAAATGGLVLGVRFESPARAAVATSEVTAWVSISSNEVVTIQVGASEMGQGVLSGLPQILAEELMVDWRKVVTEAAPAGAAYINPLMGAQMTGGSMSVRGYFQAMLKAGATAREMLVAAAAARLGVSPGDCTVTRGVVTSTSTGQSVTYGAVAADAALLTPPANPTLLSSTRGFQLVGKPVARPDLPRKVNGKALYGIDVRVPGMVYAAIKHCPTIGGSVVGTPATPAGTLAVVPLGNAVAVVAKDTWSAFVGARNVQVNWSIPAASNNLDSSVIATQAASLMSTGTPVVAETEGNPDGALATAQKVLTMTYSVPYLPHACMEPLNCTVQVLADRCDIWVPTQAPGLVVFTASAITGLAPDKIFVHSMLMGGGLGRKFEQDFVAQAVKVAKAIGKPVKLTWSREEDFGNDQFRPMALSRVKAGLDANGRISGWVNRIVSPSILLQRGWIQDGQVDSQAVDGAVDLSYGFLTRRTEYVRHPSAIPAGFWRSVGHSFNAFIVESAIDEMALAAGADPLALRRKLLVGKTRQLTVLNAAAKLGGWGTALPAGRARGIAFNESFGSLCAQVIEIEQVSPAGVTPVQIKVVRVSCAVDCGIAINPDSIEAQMQSGIVHGLNAAQWGEIRFDKGRPQTRNFDNYPMMRLHDMPKVDVKIVTTPGVTVGGIGEVGVPCTAPALANAYAALTGVRLRNLPLRVSTATSGEA